MPLSTPKFDILCSVVSMGGKMETFLSNVETLEALVRWCGTPSGNDE